VQCYGISNQNCTFCSENYEFDENSICVPKNQTKRIIIIVFAVAGPIVVTGFLILCICKIIKKEEKKTSINSTSTILELRDFSGERREKIHSQPPISFQSSCAEILEEEKSTEGNHQKESHISNSEQIIQASENTSNNDYTQRRSKSPHQLDPSLLIIEFQGVEQGN